MDTHPLSGLRTHAGLVDLREVIGVRQATSHIPYARAVAYEDALIDLIDERRANHGRMLLGLPHVGVGVEK